MENQVTQSAVFAKDNSQEIASVERELLLAGKKLLEVEGCKVLLQATYLRAMSALGKSDLYAFFAVIREEAFRFVSLGDSKPYWTWIDAAGFYFDATGSQWPFMSLAQREKYLSWSLEGVSKPTSCAA